MRWEPRSEKALVPVPFAARTLETRKTAKAHLLLLNVSLQVIRAGDRFKSVEAWLPEFQALLGSITEVMRSFLQNSITVRMRKGMNVRVREQDGVWVEVCWDVVEV